MVGVASVAVIFNALLAKYFIVVRYICDCCGSWATLVTQLTQLLTFVADYVLLVLYVVYVIKELTGT